MAPTPAPTMALQAGVGRPRGVQQLHHPILRHRQAARGGVAAAAAVEAYLRSMVLPDPFSRDSLPNPLCWRHDSGSDGGISQWRGGSMANHGRGEENEASNALEAAL